jgi:hypothetical protein
MWQSGRPALEHHGVLTVIDSLNSVAASPACTKRVQSRYRVDCVLELSSVFQAVPLVQPLASVRFRRMTTDLLLKSKKRLRGCAEGGSR